jgi:hypothetical protein
MFLTSWLTHIAFFLISVVVERIILLPVLAIQWAVHCCIVTSMVTKNTLCGSLFDSVIILKFVWFLCLGQVYTVE